MWHSPELTQIFMLHYEGDRTSIDVAERRRYATQVLCIRRWNCTVISDDCLHQVRVETAISQPGCLGHFRHSECLALAI